MTTTDPSEVAPESTSADRRPRPRTDVDSAEYWRSAAAGTLSLPRCQDCGAWQFPPRERCATCGGSITYQAHSGAGTVYSYVVMHHSTIPGFDELLPYGIALVEFEAGCRIPARLIGAWDRASIIGSQVQASFEQVAGVPPALVVGLTAHAQQTGAGSD